MLLEFGRVEDQRHAFVAQLVDRLHREHAEDAAALVVGIGGGVDGAHRGDEPAGGTTELPAHERTQAHDALAVEWRATSVTHRPGSRSASS